MTLGLFLWMILFLVLNTDETMYTIYGVLLILAIVVGIIGGVYCKD